MNVGDPPHADNRKTPLEKFKLRCEAIALLWQIGECGDDQRALPRAVDQAFAVSLGFPEIDTDTAQLIMGRAFAAVRDDLGGWRP